MSFNLFLFVKLLHKLRKFLSRKVYYLLNIYWGRRETLFSLISSMTRSVEIFCKQNQSTHAAFCVVVSKVWLHGLPQSSSKGPRISLDGNNLITLLYQVVNSRSMIISNFNKLAPLWSQSLSMNPYWVKQHIQSGSKCPFCLKTSLQSVTEQQGS